MHAIRINAACSLDADFQVNAIQQQALVSGTQQLTTLGILTLGARVHDAVARQADLSLAILAVRWLVQLVHVVRQVPGVQHEVPKVPHRDEGDACQSTRRL